MGSRRDTASRTTATAAGAVGPAPATPPLTPPAAVAAPPAPTTPPPAEGSFARFIARRQPRSDLSAQRQYTAGGLRRLADELRTLGASRAGVAAIRMYADSLAMVGVQGDAHADRARAAFLAAVREIDLLRERHAIAVDTGRLRSNAWAISPRRSLLAQHAGVQAFFESARDALHLMPRRR